MKNMSFADAIEGSLAHAMEKDERIIIFGEDVHLLRVNLFTRFGGERVRAAPISESAFLGAAVAAAMAGCRPVVEIMLIDFIGVAADAVVNHAAKIECFSGNKWQVPLVVRASCGGGYGDGGQHEQALWGWLAHIPGLSVVVPSNPHDAGALMLAAIEKNGPVIYLEHKLLADYWRDYLGSGGRSNVFYDVPENGSFGPVPDMWEPIPIGKANVLREGTDITLVSAGVGVHRCIEAADILKDKQIASTVIDLRSISPIDVPCLVDSVSKTKSVVVVDEDYRQFGLSGEIAALLLENNIRFTYRRVCTEETIPYARDREDQVLPNAHRIVEAAETLLA